MLILYGSQTGTTEAYAKIVQSFALARGLPVRVMPASAYDMTKLETEDTVIFMTSTFYNGEFPDNFTNCYEYLVQRKEPLLNVAFAVFGLGSSTTKDNFNRAAKALQSRLLSLHARELIPAAFGDEHDAGGHDTAFRPWVKALWVQLLGEHSKLTLPIHYDFKLVSGPAPTLGHNFGAGYEELTVVSNERLTAEGYERPSYLMTMNLPDHVNYALGDHVQVAYANSNDLVERLAARLGLDLNTIVELTPRDDSATELPLRATVRQLFTNYLDLSTPPTRSFLDGLSALCTNAEEAATLEHLAEDMSATNSYLQYISGGPHRRPFTLVDVLEDFASIKLTLAHLLGNVPPISPRYYSICTSPLVHPHQIQIVYSVDQWHTSKNFTGASAGFLSRQTAGSKVVLKVSKGYFTHPESLDTPILGVALGTGIAFFRALLQHRSQQQQSVARVRLYFGIRHAAKDFLFKQELLKYEDNGILELVVACSHDSATFVTPATKMQEFPHRVCEYLDNGGVYYYCGLGGAIPSCHEAAVLQALQAGHGSTLAPEASAINTMKESGRWQVEAFSRSVDHENALQSTIDAVQNNDAKPIGDVLGDCAMFCYQCGQTNQGIGCTKVGVCGKTPTVAALQDLLIDHMKQLSWLAHHIRLLEPTDNQLMMDVNRFSLLATFSTLTNVNFDASRFVAMISEVEDFKAALNTLYKETCQRLGVKPEPLPWGELPLTGDLEDLVSHGKKVGVLSRLRSARNDALVGLQEMLVYGLKGLAAYTDHSLQYGLENSVIYNFIHEAFSFLYSKDASNLEKVLEMLMRCGQVNFIALELLHNANNTHGAQSPSVVQCKPVPGKAILVSGHDLKMLRDLLDQCEGYKAKHGVHINVFTHGELLPAHGYPGLRQSTHLAGHFGAAWQRQSIEFAYFPGAILMTTNCLTQPKPAYKDRLFTAGAVGWADIPHISTTDYTPVIEMALSCNGFTAEDKEFAYPPNPFVPAASEYNVGWGSETVIGAAPTVLKAVAAGDISRFYVIGGCDGYEGERSYYTELAAALPPSSVVLTVGCGKFRLNHLQMGTIGATGIPRLLDLGQCNDSYSAVQIALALAGALNCGVNELPVSIVLSWFEQKAVVVLLTLLSLGIRNIRVGPTVPAFLRPSIFKVLHEKFNLNAIGADVHEDIAKMVQGA
ncbi:hypothetical protein THRCLA_01603 [Thraustotheca clavata]|uniref:Hydroxylamine reductase n=1 Tax=Thraustotheca clavata TaxID=74557 RepID=A0A1W0A7T3_9STRA|nr:hypothetical protein THRCLA_01603 [Thraustotheca clavata]